MKLEEMTGKLPALEVEDEKFKKATIKIETMDKIIEVFRTLPDNEMYGEVLKIVLDVMESIYGVFGYLDKEENWVCPSITRDIWDKCDISGKSVIFPRKNWIDYSVWKIVYKERKTAIQNYPVKTPKGHLEIKRIMITPILFNSTLIGMISVANKKTDYIEDDKDILEQIARLVSPILMARLQRDGILQKGVKNAARERME